jgi:hypothetical protein
MKYRSVKWNLLVMRFLFRVESSKSREGFNATCYSWSQFGLDFMLHLYVHVEFRKWGALYRYIPSWKHKGKLYRWTCAYHYFRIHLAEMINTEVSLHHTEFQTKRWKNETLISIVTLQDQQLFFTPFSTFRVIYITITPVTKTHLSTTTITDAEPNKALITASFASNQFGVRTEKCILIISYIGFTQRHYIFYHHLIANLNQVFSPHFNQPRFSSMSRETLILLRRVASLSSSLKLNQFPHPNHYFYPLTNNFLRQTHFPTFLYTRSKGNSTRLLYDQNNMKTESPS